jgi:hypothetical protein
LRYWAARLVPLAWCVAAIAGFSKACGAEPAADAAAYLFAEFDRLRILQSEFFVRDDSFRTTTRLAPDPAVQRSFEARLARADELAKLALSKSPADTNAMFAGVLVLGLRADYQGLIEKRYLASLATTRAGRAAAERLLAVDPNYHDAWLAIACFEEEDWRALCRVAGHDEWLRDRRFADLADRLANQDQLDLLVSSWTAGQDAFKTMQALQEAGVPAGVCQTAADRCDRDPQLRHLNWMTELPGTKIGTWPVPEVPVRMSGATVTVGGITNRGSPTYGEDNAYVYGQLLGMSEREIAELAADNVI